MSAGSAACNFRMAIDAEMEHIKVVRININMALSKVIMIGSNVA
jgi:hypothetical protein